MELSAYYNLEPNPMLSPTLTKTAAAKWLVLQPEGGSPKNLFWVRKHLLPYLGGVGLGHQLPYSLWTKEPLQCDLKK